MATSLTKAEFRLLDSMDYEIDLDQLNGSRRALVQRMKEKGLISKRRYRDGSVRVTEKGKRAWWRIYHKVAR